MTFRISRATTTPEERVAKRIKTIVEDLHLDLEQTGIMMARVLPELTYNRLVAMIEAAEFEKEAIRNPQLRNERYRQLGLF
jgi:hypothetical protein